MSSSQLSIDALPAWARLNDVELNSVDLEHTDQKGYGLVADHDLDLNNGPSGMLLRVPRDLVLSANAVEDYAKMDQNFRQLLDVAGHKSTRHDILLYLLTRHITAARGGANAKGVAPTSWTEYVKFLPRQIPVPTMWSDAERTLLKGTSLESAVVSKLAALSEEFELLRDQTSELPFWNSLLWQNETANIGDWVLVDARYRSRSLELPQAGHAMVPALDIANHSSAPTAYYEEDDQGDVALFLRPASTVPRGQEITISYGEDKPAAEMLFSYGFVEEGAANKHEMALPLPLFPDDPLAKAKLHVFSGPATVRVFRTEGNTHWQAPFIHLMCLNEEDGLDFRVLQDTEGNRQLKVFWQDCDVTEQANNFESLTDLHHLRPVFRLRAITILHELVKTQLERIQSPVSPERIEEHEAPETIREECADAASVLRRLETLLLEKATEALEHQQFVLMDDQVVKEYLGLLGPTEVAQNEHSSTPSGPPTNDEPDFS